MIIYKAICGKKERGKEKVSINMLEEKKERDFLKGAVFKSYGGENG